MFKRAALTTSTMIGLMALLAAGPNDASTATTKPAFTSDEASANFKYLAVGQSEDEVDALFSKERKTDYRRSSNAIRVVYAFPVPPGSYQIRCRFSAEGKLQFFDEKRY